MAKTSYEPLNVKSIEHHVENVARYRIALCAGKGKSGNKYTNDKLTITFISKDEKGKIIPGVHPDQLAYIMRDYLSKQENIDQTKLKALDTFLGINKTESTDSTETTAE